MIDKYYVYILADKNNEHVYIGITNNIPRRIEEHMVEPNTSYAKRYKTYKLVYNEYFSNPDDAILREKQIKRWSRSKKNWLIETINPDWSDLLRI